MPAGAAIAGASVGLAAHGAKVLGETVFMQEGHITSEGETGFKGRRGVPENKELGLPKSDGLELKQPKYQPTRNKPDTINGRDYSAHALDQMQNRGVMPSVVENAIKSGSTPGKNVGTLEHVDLINRVKVVTDAKTGKVVTVIPQ